MKRVLSLVLALVMVLGMIPMGFAADQTAGEILKGYELLAGDETGNLNEDKYLNRAEMMVILARMNGKFNEAKNFALPSSYTDLAGFGWAVPYIAYAELNEWTSGVGGGKFDPAGHVTLQMAAYFMVEALGYADPADFSWATAVEKATSLGLLAGLQLNAGDHILRGDLFKTMLQTLNTDVKGEAVKLGSKLGVKGFVAPVPANIAVESVAYSNAKQIQVKFNKAVDADYAEDLANYYLLRASAAKVAISSVDPTAVAELQDDDMTVIITATNNITSSWSIVKDAAFTFIVDGVKDKAGVTAPVFSQILVNTDKVSPTFVSASAKARLTTNTITLKFSEPVTITSGMVKVSGKYVQVQAGSNANELKVTTSDNLAAGQSYSLEILNFKDFADNLMMPNIVATTFVVTQDVAAPVVTEVKVTSDNIVDVTFDKALDVATVVPNNFRILDGNATLLNSNYGVGIKANSGNKTVRITLDNDPSLPFNSNNTLSLTLVITDNVRDSLGNKFVAASRSIVITKDTVKPAVISMAFVKANATGTKAGVSLANGAISVKYSENVALLATTAAGIRIINNNGVDVTATYVDNASIVAARVNADDKTELVIPLKTTVADTITSLTVRFPAEIVKDLSLSANKSEASVNTISVESGVNVTDTTRPVVVEAVGVTARPNTITISITEANDLDAASVLDLNNYRLDGQPLPNGTYAIVSGTKPNHVVTLYLPDGTVSKSQNYAFNVSGIKDKSGNVANAVAFNTISLIDDVKPIFNSVVLNSDGTVSLGFDEKVTGVVVNDFIVTLNEVALTGVVKAYTLTPVTAGADEGKILLTVNALVHEDEKAPDVKYIDVNGNSSYDAGVDIVVATGESLMSGAVDLNNALYSSLKVKTATSTVGADIANNTLKTGVEKVVK